MKDISRRSILAAGAALSASASVGVAASMGNMSPLAAAIARHNILRAEADFEAWNDDRMAQFCSEEFEAIEAIARAPCASDAEFLIKLRKLFDFEMECWGWEAPDMHDCHGSIIIAMCHKFYPEVA